MNDKSRLTERLEQIPGEVSDATDSVFEAAAGEILIDHPEAPERGDFSETDEGYREYLSECYTWTAWKYQKAAKTLASEADDLHFRLDEIPHIDDQRKEARIEREGVDLTTENVTNYFETVAEWHNRLKKIENEVQG